MFWCMPLCAGFHSFVLSGRLLKLAWIVQSTVVHTYTQLTSKLLTLNGNCAWFVVNGFKQAHPLVCYVSFKRIVQDYGKNAFLPRVRWEDWYHSKYKVQLSDGKLSLIKKWLQGETDSLVKIHTEPGWLFPHVSSVGAKLRSVYVLYI